MDWLSAVRVVLVLSQDRAGPVDLTVALARELAGRPEGHRVFIVGPKPVSSAGDVSGLVREVSVRSKGDLRGALRLRRVLTTLRPDVVHAQDRRSALMAATLARGRAPVVATYHGIPDALVDHEGDPGQDPARDGKASPAAMAILAADAAVARLVATTVAPSTAVADFLVDRLRVPRARVSVITNGVDPPPSRPPRGPARVFASVSTFSPRKAMPRLVDAFIQVARSRTDLQLRLIGDGDERELCERRAADAGLDSRIEFTGYRTDVRAQLSDADAFVLPSLAENMPLALLDAMGAGLACVATRVGGVPEAMPEGCGLLVPSNDTAALARAMARLADEPALAGALGAAGADRMRRFYSISRCTDQHLLLWRSLTRLSGAA